MISYIISKLLLVLNEPAVIHELDDVFVTGSIIEFGIIGLFLLWLVVRALLGFVDRYL